MDKYFKEIEKEVSKAHKVATAARKKNIDPEPEVGIILAKNMAERVLGLISTVAPELTDTKVIKRVHELEKEYGTQAWEVALKIAGEVANEQFCRFEDKKKAMEVGIRVGMAYSTSGIVAAPIEGFIELKIKKRVDGKEYLSCFYAGPIRGAGGTAAAFSVLITDYIRRKFGYARYDPSDKEVKRYCTEIRDYHERVTNLQYYPSEEEVAFLAKNIPVEINGDPTETIEVSNYKDLERVETNRVRGGMCLVMAEGLAQKAPKIWKKMSKFKGEFDLEWGFLKELLEIQKRKKAADKAGGTEKKITPNYTYLADLVAGRPILSHPMRQGGFRLRYGRGRVSGYSSASINPATTYVLNNYIAIGTQLKVERPGKATAITTCDEIEGPIVKLTNGTVLRLKTEESTKQILNQIDKVLFLGDLLVSYGDFSENGHRLVPCGYCEEWWALELEKATVNLFGALDPDKLSDLIKVSKENIEKILKYPRKIKLTARAAINLSLKLNIPLHPEYTPFWSAINAKQFLHLCVALDKAIVIKKDLGAAKINIVNENPTKTALEQTGIPHTINEDNRIEIKGDHALALFTYLLQNINLEKIKELCEQDKPTLEILNQISTIKIRDKSGTFIGARMGRPEKAKLRKLDGQPQILFPVGEEGGRLRSFQSAIERGRITGDFPIFHCSKCNRETIYPICEVCDKKTKKQYYCRDCGVTDSETCPKHGPNQQFRKKEIDIKHYFDNALNKIKAKVYPDLIKGVRGTSNKDHVPENLAKGILRASNEIYVNKDGTTRYDMTELPITHFKPVEIGTTIGQLKELGYVKDINGVGLSNTEQILELKPQDVILPGYENPAEESAGQVLFKVSKFIDEMLQKLYNLPKYYNLGKQGDLIGHLMIGLAPHISAGMIGRIIGFSKTQGCFAHPLWHAALRRDCDGDECCVMLLMDAFINFSRKYLPDKRGSRTMDSPLVLTTKLIPAEVDDMVHGLDVAWKYSLEFYEAAQEFKFPWDIKIEQLGNRLGTEKQYEKMGFTHNTENFNNGVQCSAYKILPSMREKLTGQMQIAERLISVDESDVARLVIEKHFLRDIKGNLRKFSQQQFRCVKCNEKYRRPPLIGKCTRCGGKIIFTISEGSIVKYLEPSLSLADKYDVPTYLKQTLLLTKQRIEGVFGKQKEKQVGLGAWF